MADDQKAALLDGLERALLNLKNTHPNETALSILTYCAQLTQRRVSRWVARRLFMAKTRVNALMGPLHRATTLASRRTSRLHIPQRAPASPQCPLSCTKLVAGLSSRGAPLPSAARRPRHSRT